MQTHLQATIAHFSGARGYSQTNIQVYVALLVQDLVEIASRFTLETPSHKLQLLKSHLLNLRRTAGVPVSTERAVATTEVFAAYRYTAVTAKVEYAAYRSDLTACKYNWLFVVNNSTFEIPGERQKS